MTDSGPAWSLRRRVALITAASMCMALLLGGAAMYWAATLEDNQMLDARLEHLGATVLSFVEDELSERAKAGSAPGKYLKTRPTAALLYRYQVWAKDGTLMLRSHEAPASRPLLELSRYGFDTVQIDGEEYRVFSLPTRDGEFVIQVAECIDERAVQVGTITAYYMGVLLLPCALVFCATWLLLRRSLRSIDTLANHLQHRNPLDVTRLHVEAPPQEMLPILGSLDALFARVGHAISVERRFTSVAAHEMRTPLAGLRAQAQLARGARTQVESNEALGSLIVGVDRASRILDQLLDLARIESMSKDVDANIQPVDVSGVYQGIMGDLGPRANARRITMAARLGVDDFQGLDFPFYLVLRNLIANAILYSPEGGRVEVAMLRQGSAAVLTVDDSGTGIAPPDRERAFQRFDRLGQSQTEGVGLGLSIVLLAVELHRGKIQLLDSALGGLRVHVLFPQPKPELGLTPQLTHAAA